MLDVLFSRRIALILKMQLFDPLGYIILIQNSARLLYQETILLQGVGSHWDEPN